MSEPQYPPITPNFAVRDPRATIAWFEKLGFVSHGTLDAPDGSVIHGELARGPARVMIGPAMGEVGAPGLELYLHFDSGIDEYYQSVVASGVTISDPIKDEFWGGRTFKVEHPDGYRIMFGQMVKEVSMEELEVHVSKEVAAATA